MGAANVARFRAAAIRAAALLAGLALAAGCRRATLPPPEPTTTSAAEPRPETGSFALPPTRAALERQLAWIDRPVRDAVAWAREQEAGDPPRCSVDEAFALATGSAASDPRIAAALFGPPAVAPPADARASRHLRADVSSLNPLRAETVADFDLLGLTALGLFGFDRDLEPFASAAVVRTWRSSADGLVDLVELRDDLVWSDGTPVTARDVTFTWRLIVDSRVPARAFRDGARRLRNVHAYDDRTIAYVHEAPLATNARDLDFPVLPRHVYGRTWEADPSLTTSDAHAALERRPVTGGPYELAARTPGREIVLRSRTNWSIVRGRKVRAEPAFAEIRLRVVEDPAAALEAVAAGDLDEAVLAPDQWVAAGDGLLAGRAARVSTPEWRSLLVAWNNGSPWFGDRRVRRAMGWAFDHGRLHGTLCHGLAAPGGGFFPPDSWPGAGRRVEVSRQDLDKAEALLDESGWVDHDGDGVRDREIDGRRVPFEFTLLCDRRPFDVAVCTLLRDCLARVGVTCVVRAVESGVLRDELCAGRHEACLVSWGAAADPDAAGSLWVTGGGRNHCGYSNPEVDRLFAEARREADRGRRARIYARIRELLAEDEPCTCLAWRHELRCVSRRLGGRASALRGATHWSPGLSSVWLPTLQ